jgi:hypothetical protein
MAEGMDIIPWAIAWVTWYVKTMFKACFVVGVALMLFTIITGM